MKRLKYLLIAIGFYANFSIFAQSGQVYLQGKDFYINGQQFYPVGVDFSIVIFQNSSGDFCISPDAGYTQNLYPAQPACTRIASLAALAHDFSILASLHINCIRVVGNLTPQWYVGTPVASPSYTGLIFQYSYCPTCNPTCGTFQQLLSYPYNPSVTINSEYFSMIQDLLNTAATYNIKVVLGAMGDFLASNQALSYYEAYLTQLSTYFANNTTLMAYDLINEPNDEPNTIVFTKDDVCNITSQLYSIIKSNAPNQLVTIGDLGSADVSLWDPAVMSLDFVCFHPYGSVPGNTNQYLNPPAVYNPAQVTPNINRVLSEIYWYGQNVSMPWMLGETGFSSVPNPLPNIMYPNGQRIDGSYTDQANFVAQTLVGAKASGAAGYLFWMYGDENWGEEEQDNNGIIDENGLRKPVTNSFANFNPFTVNAPSTQPPNYYNYFSNAGIPARGTVVDQNNQPISGAVVVGWDKNFKNEVSTFSQTTGAYTLNSVFSIPPNPIDNMVANATSYATSIIANNTVNNLTTDFTLNGFPDDNYNLSNQTITNTQLYDARNYISAGNNYIVSSNNGNVTFKAGKVITLFVGFDAQQGSYFDAKYGIPINCSNVAVTGPGTSQGNNGGGGDRSLGDSADLSLNSFLLKEPASVTDSTPTAYISPNPTGNGQTTAYISNSSDYNEIRITDLLGNTILLIPNPKTSNKIDI